MTGGAKPRLLLADDHGVVAEGFARLFAERFDVVGVAADGESMIRMHESLRPDLVVADVAMPRLGGIEAARRILASHPQARIAMLSMHDQPEHVRTARAIGVRGFLSKTLPPRTVLAALDSIAHGGTWFAAGETSTRPELSSRQRQVIAHLAAGRSLAQTAEAIGISVKTVEYHKYRVMRELGLRSSSALVRFAIEAGIACGEAAS
jgi:two-component system NarL family response regulator